MLFISYQFEFLFLALTSFDLIKFIENFVKLKPLLVLLVHLNPMLIALYVLKVQFFDRLMIFLRLILHVVNATNVADCVARCWIFQNVALFALDQLFLDLPLQIALLGCIFFNYLLVHFTSHKSGHVTRDAMSAIEMWMHQDVL